MCPPLGHVLVLADEPRHRRREADALELLQVEEIAQERTELVACAMRLGRDAPALAECVPVVQTEDGLRVPDVDREQHRAILRGRFEVHPYKVPAVRAREE